MSKLIGFSLMFLIGIFLFQNDLSGQDRRISLLFDISYNPIVGGFDGKSALVGDDKAFMVPSLDGAQGYGISVGTNSVESSFSMFTFFKYSRTVYDATFLGNSLGKANFNLYGIEVKMLFPAEKTTFSDGTLQTSIKRQIVQFYLFSGIDAGNLKVKDAFYLSSVPDVFHDASFVWVGLPVGIGIAINPVRFISFNLGAGYRFATVTGAKEAGSKKDPLELEDKVGIGGVRCDAGISFNF